MYGKYSLFYESHKNLGYYAHAQTVNTRPLFGGSGLGTKLAAWLLGLPSNHIAINLDGKTCYILWNHSVTVLLIVLINKLLV